MAFRMLFVLWLALIPRLVFAAVVPFDIDGLLEGVTADTTDFNTGGNIVANGLKITIPKNLQVQFPAAFVPFKDFAGGSFAGNEVSVIGNFVNGVPIAAMVSIGQYLTSHNTGTIQSVSFDGAITLVGGQIIRINDPNAVYSVGTTKSPFFTADDQNPTISAFSGFPMCVPRSSADTKCPASNRPSGQTSFTAPDPLVMAPFLAGDYIEFSGIKINGELLCYSIVAPSVQIKTTGVPAYIRVEDANIGVFDGQSTDAAEFADTRFVGYTSDSSVSVLITRSEVDACTGKVTDVQIGSATISAADVRNKWIWRADSTAPTKYSREYKVTASTGTKATNGGQILAGQYITAVTELIFPEQRVPGAIPAKNEFSSFIYLRDGLGPDANGNRWGQLSPWPDTTAPNPSVTCTTNPPAGGTPTSVTANAGPDQATRPGARVNLVGTVANASSFPSGDVTYVWSQTAGPTVTLSTSDNTATFIAGKPTAVTKLTFQLKASSATTKTSSVDLVDVTIDPNAVDTVVVDSYTWASTQSGTISVTAHSNVVDGTAKLSLILNNPSAGSPITMTDAGGGKFTYNARSTKKPSNGVTVSSNLGGKASLTSTTS